MTVLTTIEADDFRETVGGTRKYTGGVLGENRYASVTSIKPAKAFKGRTPWGTVVSLDVLRAAEWVADHRDELDEYMGRDELIEAVASAPAEIMGKASGRGTRIHDAIAEHILEES